MIHLTGGSLSSAAATATARTTAIILSKTTTRSKIQASPVVLLILIGLIDCILVSANITNNVLFAPQTTTTKAAAPTNQVLFASDKIKDDATQAVDMNGLYLVGLFDLHQPVHRQPFRCGQLDDDAGERQIRRPMQNLEAFLWAIEQINSDGTLLPGIRLNPLVLDTCSSYLRTNQMVANLLHNGQINLNDSSGINNELPAQQTIKSLPAQQIAAIVADNYDFESIESVSSMASSLGLTTFVTQCRSGKLIELERKYQRHYSSAVAPAEDSNNNHQITGSDNNGSGSNPPNYEAFLSELLGIGRMIPAPDTILQHEAPIQVPKPAKERLLRRRRRRIVRSPMSFVMDDPTLAMGSSDSDDNDDDDGTNDDDLASSSSNDRDADRTYSGGPNNRDRVQLLMVRMPIGNEIVADAIASLLEQMNWSLVSIVYDGGDADMIDLHDELARQLFVRNVQLAVDEQVPAGNSNNKDFMDKLVMQLSDKTQIGARVVITLLTPGNARSLLDSLRRLRSSLWSPTGKLASSQQQVIVERLNSLLWITTTDREPYYSYATEALGTIVVSGATSLMAEFRAHYDNIPLSRRLSPNFASATTATLTGAVKSGNSTATTGPIGNRYWSEYLRSILRKNKQFEPNFELIANECFKWKEPQTSLLQGRCQSLSLKSIVDTERSSKQQRQRLLLASAGAGTGGSQSKLNRDLQQQSNIQTSKYLANGWEHNGMDVINAVVAIANGLEYVRKQLCPDQSIGMCKQMQDLVMNGELRWRSYLQAPTGVQKDSPGPDQYNVAPASGNGTDIIEGAPMTVSEMMLAKLRGSTFQLADGRMFGLSPTTAAGSSSYDNSASEIVMKRREIVRKLSGGILTAYDNQLKMYNLRYLRQNSIGFVRFGQFDPDSLADGLSVNTSKALHYPTLSYKQQVPIHKIVSQCNNEHKCLIYGTSLQSQSSYGDIYPARTQNNSNSGPILTTNTNSSAGISESELASNINSLFKLDHPFIWSSSSSVSQPPPSQAQSAASNNNQQSSSAGQRPSAEQTTSNLRSPSEAATSTGGNAIMANVRSLESHLNSHSAAAVASGFVEESKRFSAAADRNESSATPQMLFAPVSSQTVDGAASKFELIVLLPLHRHRSGATRQQSNGTQLSSSPTLLRHLSLQQQSSTTPTTMAANANTVLDFEHRYKQVHLWPSNQSSLLWSCSLEQSFFDTSSEFQQLVALAYSQQQYTQPIGTRQQQQQLLTITVIDYCDSYELARQTLTQLIDQRKQSASTATQQYVSTPIGVLDFDRKLADQLDPLITSARLLHINIAKPSDPVESAQPITGDSIGNKDDNNNMARVDLTPSKLQEIQALVELVHAMPDWRLVHLIYTDRHHYRDEFIRRANELNVCVSKLVWIPNESPNNHISRPEVAFEQRLEIIKDLFEGQFYNYRQSGAGAKFIEQSSDLEDLSSTKVLVVLASSQAETNRLIAQAATESMLNDYVWVTTHEWLDSVEKVALASDQNFRDVSDATDANSLQPMQTPRNLLATRLETYESHEFRHYFAHLTPSIHKPLPTDWFDEFWEQKFNCKLPIASSVAVRAEKDRLLMHQHTCPMDHHLDAHRIIEDDRIHYTMRAVSTLQAILPEWLRTSNQSAKSDPLISGFDFSDQSFVNSFKQIFDGHYGRRPKQQQGQHTKVKHHLHHHHSNDLFRRQSATWLPATGFQIIHKLLAPPPTRNRSSNSRQMVGSGEIGQMVRVGLWRADADIVLVPWKRVVSNGIPRAAEASVGTDTNTDTFANITDSLDATVAEGNADDWFQIGQSLSQISSIKSRCQLSKTCDLCRKQIGSTLVALQLERSRLSLNNRLAKQEHSAISSILVPEKQQLPDQQQTQVGQQQQHSNSILDLMPNTNFVAVDSSDPGKQNSSSKADSESDSIQASASSLFDTPTKQEVANQREVDTQRAYNHLLGRSLASSQSSWTGNPMMSLSLRNGIRRPLGAVITVLSLLGIVCMVASLANLYPTNSTKSMVQNFSDYFLLAGLLMLYSINIAFLLPATYTVCWFRRIAMPLSYTMMFGSILMKIINIKNICSTMLPSRQRKSSYKKSLQSSMQSDSLGSPELEVHAGAIDHHQQTDSFDDSINVSFESLPYESDQQQQQQQVVQTNLNGGLNNNDKADESICSVQNYNYYNNPVGGYTNSISRPDRILHHQSRGNATFKPLLVWIIIQLLISLVWLSKKPPELTLYRYCWHCSSPTRSQIMFLWEYLLSLIYPMALLVYIWFGSIRTYRLASNVSALYNTHRPDNISSLDDKMYQQQQQIARIKQSCEPQIGFINELVRTAKSLIACTTAIIFTWSIMIISMISFSRKIMLLLPDAARMSPTSPIASLPLHSPSQAPSQQAYLLQQHHQQQQQFEDLTLVYANIVSGAIIFIFLFIYRLNLLRNCFRYTTATIVNAKASSYLKPSAISGHNRNKAKIHSLSNTYDSSHSNNNSNGLWMSFDPSSSPSSSSINHQHHNQDHLIFDRSNVGQSFFSSFNGTERLQIQQQSSYGTYTNIAFNNNNDLNHSEQTHELKQISNTKQKQKQKRSNKVSKTKGKTATAHGQNSDQRKEIAPENGSSPPMTNGKSSNLQRRRSSGSVASSTAPLVAKNTDDSVFDTISCASIAESSTSTSQLRGNDLYPIDCSIQFDTPMTNAASGT